MQKKAVPLRYLLLGAFLLAGLLPSLLITSLSFYEAKSVLKTEIKRDIETRAKATAGEIDRMMFERLQNVASWSKLEVMQDLKVGDVDKRLSKFLNDLKISYHGVYRELYVLDKNGFVIASSDPGKLGSKPDIENIWLSTRLGQSDIRLSSLQSEMLAISTPIQDAIEVGDVGTLVAVFDWNQIRQVLNASISGRGAAALFDGKSRLIESTENWQKIQAYSRFSARAKSEGYQGFSGFAWQVEISLYRSEALAPVRNMAYIFIGLLISSLFLATLMAIPVARSITKPVARLREFANRFMLAPSHELPPAGGPAEIDAMAQAFGKMIRDLEQSRENLTRAAKLAVVGEMAAAMSHEVRTPLGILRSSAQVLLREPDLSPEAREVCGFIISETERLNKLVTTLVDSAKPHQPVFSPHNLGELANQSASMLRIQAEKKNIELICHADNIFVDCDAEQMTQVFLNLLLNAIQVLPENGKIELTVKQLPGYVQVLVADNGPGIAPDFRKQVFDPFFTKRAGGIGLGLAVVRQIVLAHHGEISVHQSQMGGAEFRVLLPLAE